MRTLPWHRWATGGALAVALAVAAGCGNITTPVSSSTSSTTTSSTGAAGTSIASSSIAPGAKGGTVLGGGQYAQYYKPRGKPVTVKAGAPVQIQMADIYYNPNTLSVAKGTKVTIDLKNTGALPHTFTSGALKVNTLVNPGKSATLTFTPTKAGVYYWYCVEPGHAQAGMVGQLTVK